MSGINYTLTSQQKDLLIIHLKGEVYELKQADSDYQSLLLQVQTLEQRMRKLTDEKEHSLRQYELQLHSQQTEITVAEDELTDVVKHSTMVNQENEEIAMRIERTAARISDTEHEYGQVRNQTSDVLAANKHLKSGLSLIQAALKTELDINEENTLRQETAKRNLAKITNDIIWEQSKEEQLKAHLAERGRQIGLREDQLVEMDDKQRERENRHNSLHLEVISFRNGGGIVDHEVPHIQRGIDKQLDDKNQLLLKLRHEELKNSEMAIRLEEVNDRLERRDKEYDDVDVLLKAVTDHNALLVQDKEQLILHRQNAAMLAEDIKFSNEEIEKEFEEMLKVDETIQRTIDVRDRKVSPVIYQTRQTALNYNESMFQQQQMQQSVIKSLALPTGQLSGFKKMYDENNQRGINEDILSTKDGAGSFRLLTSVTKDSQFNKTNNQQQQIRFLNPRSLNIDQKSGGSAFKEFKSAAKLGSSPLRFRHL